MAILPYNPLVQLGQALANGLATGQSRSDLAGSLSPLLASLNGSADLHPHYADNLRALVEGRDGVSDEILLQTAQALLLSDLRTLSPDEAARRLQDITQVMVRASSAPLWTPGGSALPHVRGENREMTMLFADLVGFSSYASVTDADALFLTINDALERLEDAIASEGGAVSGNWGDSVFALFGMKGRENHALAGVRAGLKMQKVLHDWNEGRRANGEAPFHIRIGIHSGKVAFGPLGGRDRKVMTALGDAVNVAARLEPLAKFPCDGGGYEYGILISHETLTRLGNRSFAVDDLGPVTLKGIEEPIGVYRMRYERHSISLVPRGTEQIEFVGRAAELGTLEEVYAETREARVSRLAVVRGDAGEGKSRLGEQFLKGVGSGTEVFIARGEDREASAPYEAVAEAIRSHAKIEPSDDAELARQKVRYFVESAAAEGEWGTPELERRLQLLWRLLGLPFLSDDEEVRYLLAHEAELWPQILNAVVGVLDRLARRKPLVFIFEDLHWMDPGTVRFMNVLLERLRDAPVLLLGFSRPKFLEDHPEVTSHPNARQVSLRALGEDELTAMVEEILPPLSDEAREADLPRELIALSGRNTYLLLEMAWAIQRGWRLRRDDLTGQRYFEIPNGKKGRRVALPSGALSFLQARIDLLSKTQQEVLRLAAVLGGEFRLGDMQDVVAAVRSSHPRFFSNGLATETEGMVADVLRTLVAEKFLVVNHEGDFQFPHALLRETTYGEIFQEDRAHVHRAVASQLSRKPSQDALVGSHYERAGDNARAARHYNEGAESFIAKDIDSALRLFRKAHGLATEPTQRMRILRGWDEALYLGGRYADQQETYRLSEELLDRLGPMDRAGTYRRLGRSLIRLHRHAEAEALITRALRVVEGHPEDNLEATRLKISIFDEFGFNFGETGRLQESLEHYSRAYELARKIKDPFEIARSLWGVNYALNSLGRYQGIFESQRVPYLLFRRLGNQQRRAVGCLVEWARTHLILGDHRMAGRILEQATKLSRNFGGRGQPLGHLAVTIGRALDLRGKHVEAIAVLGDYLAKNPQHERVLMNLGYLSLANLNAGRLDGAEKAAADTLEKALEKKNEEFEAVARTVLARVHWARGEREEALLSSEKAVRLVEQGKVWAEFDVDILLAHVQILSSSGRSEDAWPHVDRAKAVLEARRDTIDDPAYRESFFNLHETNREVMRTWLKLKAELVRRGHAENGTAWSDALWAAREEMFVDPEAVPVLEPRAAGRVAFADLGSEAAAGTFLPGVALRGAFDAFVGESVSIDRNPGEYPNISARDVHLVPFKSGGKLFVYVNWALEMEVPDPIRIEVLKNLGHSSYFEEVLEARLYAAPDGATHVALRRHEGEDVPLRADEGATLAVDRSLRVPPHHFGRLDWRMSERPGDGTELDLNWEKKNFTHDLRKVLEAYAALILDRLSSRNAGSV